MQIILLLLNFTVAMASDTEKCNITYFSQRAFYHHSAQDHTIQNIQKGMNKVAKKVVNVVDKVDQYTLGLVSLMLTGGRYSFANLTPSAWGKVNIEGELIYADEKFASNYLKGVEIELTENTNSIKMFTSSDGTFKESLYKLVPYTRLRIFPFPIVEIGSRSTPTFKVPFQMKIKTPQCTAVTEVRNMPLEPLIMVVSPDRNELASKQ